ncbi:DDE-type integrase/transposase/recombinase [Pseudomonas sp. PSB11]|uniref:DDE-type integrase/transposase/recombinase n=1 Tax=Pseudomonas sp. PSB11 TaxID=2021969 RepID=UPI0016609F31|nr:DDE-type integrase/transposase/recombinase [Pseudomonas sp. PSB11]MBD0677167.1 integrase [Pseudomonas sp. PSB11]
MQTFSLKLRLVVVINHTRMTLQRRLVDRRLLFVDELGEPTKLKESEFYIGYERREIEICEDQPYLGEIPVIRNVAPDLTCFPPRHSEEALRRRKYLENLTEGQDMLPSLSVLREKIQEIAKGLEDIRVPSISTIRRWFSKFSGRDVVKLVPKHSKKGRACAISGELEEILTDVIYEVYLKPERPDISKVVLEYQKRVDEKNATRLPSHHLKIPCGMTIRRYIAKLDPYEVDVHRLGTHAARKKHRTAIGVLTVNDILDRWEIDHTVMDVLLVDEETGLIIGRPYISIVFDKFSRMIMGYLIHLAAPNTETVLRVIERSIRPKAELLKRFPEVKGEWRAHGLPTRVVPDNAAEFHADDLIAGFNELGIEIMYPRSRGPEMKGSVERFFRTLNTGLIHGLPGTTFSNIQEKGDYDSEKHACFTFDQIERSVVKWIVDGYHQTPHRSLDERTPAQVWASAEANRLIKLPVDLDELECILARRRSVCVHHYGIEVDGHGYHSPELAQLSMRMAPKEKISVRFRDELGHVWVHDRFRNVFLQVPVKDKRMLGVSRDLWKAAKNTLRAKGDDKPSFEKINQCYRDLEKDVDHARHSQKLRQRRAVTRAKLDKDGWKLPNVKLPLSPVSMEWLDMPITTDETTMFRVVHRQPTGRLNNEQS